MISDKDLEILLDRSDLLGKELLNDLLDSSSNLSPLIKLQDLYVVCRDLNCSLPSSFMVAPC